MGKSALGLKQEYNNLLDRYNKAEEFMNKCTDEQFDKWQPEFLKIIVKLSELMKLMPEMSKEEILNGFKEVK